MTIVNIKSIKYVYAVSTRRLRCRSNRNGVLVNYWPLFPVVTAFSKNCSFSSLLCIQPGVSSCKLYLFLLPRVIADVLMLKGVLYDIGIENIGCRIWRFESWRLVAFLVIHKWGWKPLRLENLTCDQNGVPIYQRQAAKLFSKPFPL